MIDKTQLVGVLMGGVSSEREISLRSGKNVAAALEKLGYQILRLDIRSRDCQEQLQKSGIKAAYNILHGTFGEDGGIQTILEELKIPYTGSGVTASQNCMHKGLCKKILQKNHLPVPANVQKAPAVVKAPCEGSSIGVTIVHEDRQLHKVFTDTVKKYGPDVFIEQYLQGAEVTVGVLEDGSQLLALPILELIPKNEFYDFEAKYTPGGTKFILPANLSQAVTAQVQLLATKAFRALNCAGAVRVDFVVENRTTPYILEINTIPGMTDQSDLPAEAQAHGYSFGKLVEKILQTAALGKY